MTPSNSLSKKWEMNYAMIFIILVLVISWSYTVFAFSTSTRTNFFVLVMFFPGLIGVMLNFIRYRSVKLVFKPIASSLKLKAILFALIYPILFLTLIAIIDLTTGCGVWNTDKSSNLAQFPTLEMIIIGPFLLAGEEYGWRGFLLKEIAETKGKVIAAIVVGIVWALWHFPILYEVALHAGINDPFQFALVQMGAVFTFSFPFTYCYFLTNNIIAPMLFHFIWNFYNPILFGNMYRGQLGIIEGNLMIINGEGLVGFVLGMVCMIVFIRKPLSTKIPE